MEELMEIDIYILSNFIDKVNQIILEYSLIQWRMCNSYIYIDYLIQEHLFIVIGKKRNMNACNLG